MNRGEFPRDLLQELIVDADSINLTGQPKRLGWLQGVVILPEGD